MEKMQKVIKGKVHSVLSAHNGDIALTEVTSDGFVKVRLTGACATCPSAQQTMSEVIEAAVKEAYPELKGVILVHQVSNELIHQALKILRKR
ncbi:MULTISPECIES: NifU family protein [Pelosinus]|jgi:Fe-S cluster biogenesis protein NfuA|uniref:Nitrogen-fixing NifU domain-containing protein n=1 Tax=Pelosinus fermentans B4 TaxID=1149862 RepID=I8RHH2_9FIRM|nr:MULTISPECIES: NifU family protein [Pelosinus]EIW19213.1 nitrogen-fixing NifU domain-containing protein [Pelosinus fermentans B4]EIW25055.1 nitrogen-fixing NifU domain-containing protein [Pelosinus fermentans A11]MDF2571456.1 nfuA [Sporomusa sp.]